MVPAAGDKYNDFDIILIFFLRSLPSTSLLQCRTPWSTSGCSTFLSADRRTFGGVVSELGLAAAPSARAPQPPPAAAQSMVDRGCCTTPPRRPCPPPRTRRRGRPSQRSPRRGSAGAVTSTSFWPISRALLSSTPAHTHTPCAMLGMWCIAHRMPFGACDSMLCPISGVQARAGPGAEEAEAFTQRRDPLALASSPGALLHECCFVCCYGLGSS